MLLKITNDCAMGCSHCMEKSVPGQGAHMSMETFDKAIDLTVELESLAVVSGYRPELLLSGGECTDHPEFEKMVERAHEFGFFVRPLSHGMWLNDPERVKSYLRPEWVNLQWQITNDPRFYPKKNGPIPKDERVVFVPSLSVMLPLGRFDGKTHSVIPTRKGPSSFNFRSITHSTKDIRKSVSILRLRSSAGLSGHCSPSITHEGDAVAGESRLCWKIGTVSSTWQELTENTLKMGSCNRCGLEEGLDQQHKRAIGLSVLYTPNEG